MTMTAETIQEDIQLEARRILDAAAERGLRVKLLGGVAIRIALGDRFPAALDREYGDIDLFTTKSHCSGVESMLAEIGWEPAAQFNAINGSRRLLFSDPGSERKIDVFIDDFEMCHRLPLKKRFDLPGDTLDPADLLLTKLQIIELNAKDRGDAYAILSVFPVTEGAEGIDLGWIGDLTGKDWGLQHTLELNLGRLREGLTSSPLTDAERATVAASIDRIEAGMSEAPKSRSWKLRDRVGERKKWYDEPEEID
ncbi:MAG: hypothetical protein J0H98_05950 [Solirubrobacterales bacterium]|nr:hypothetical protein [Solirubrobacterales bacterium]